MPTTHAALLRGINVGRAKRVAMADLRAIIEGLGCRDVRTLLNSGNVVFSSSGAAGEIAARIERALVSRLGVESRVTVLTARELETVVADQPFGAVVTNPSRLMVAVPFTSAILKKVKPLTTRDWAPEALALGSRAAYVWCPDGLIESRAFDEMSKLMGDAVTTRNWATMLKVQAALR